jgi:hypothetical protein
MVETPEPVGAACPEAHPEDIQHREDALDEALAESFPASDPPAMVRSSRRPAYVAPVQRRYRRHDRLASPPDSRPASG